MEVLIKLSDAIKTLKSMAVPLVRKLPSAQPERLTDYSFEESCTECPAYDTENHRCPRFNQVIRTALKDANLEPCENCISRQAAIDAIYHHFPSVSRTRARTMLHEVPSAQSDLEAKILAAGYTGKEVRIYIGGRLFGVRELAQ